MEYIPFWVQWHGGMRAHGPVTAVKKLGICTHLGPNPTRSLYLKTYFGLIDPI